MQSQMFLAAGFVLAAGWTTAAPAQDAVESAIRFRLPVAFEYDLEADIDGGGDYDVQRLGFGAIGDTDLTDDLSLSFGTTYAFDLYNFDGETRFGGVNPWEDIQTLDLHARLDWQVADDWGLFAGPLFRWSREEGADWGDSFTGGAIVGGTYQASPDLSLGLGIGIMSQIEDDELFFPVVMVNWRINDQWRLRSSTDAAAGGALGGGSNSSTTSATSGRPASDFATSSIGFCLTRTTPRHRRVSVRKHASRSTLAFRTI